MFYIDFIIVDVGEVEQLVQNSFANVGFSCTFLKNVQNKVLEFVNFELWNRDSYLAHLVRLIVGICFLIFKVI